MEADTSQNGSPAAPAGGDSAPARSTSASAAMESAARSAATPAPATGSSPGGSAGGSGKPLVPVTTAQPVKPVTAAPAAKGPIPFEAHETALKNAREKTRQEVMQEMAWANGIDPTVAQRALALAKRLDTDPKAFAKQLADELSAQGDELPEPDLVNRDGSVKAYSAGAMKKIADQIRNQVLQQVNSQLKPFQDEKAQKEEQERTRKAASEAAEEGKKVLTEGLTHARSLPHFTDNEKAISVKLGEVSPELVKQIGPLGALYVAYSAVLIDQLAGAGPQAEERVLGDLKRRANAGSGNAAPGGPVPAAPDKKPKTTGELAKHMEHLAATMTT